MLDDHPDGHTAVVSGGERISYERLRREVAATRGALATLGLVEGDRVAILCGTNARFVRSWLAIIGSGLVAVPLNPQSPPAEIQRELHLVGARAVVAGPAGVAPLSHIDRSELPELEFVLVPSHQSTSGSIDFDALAEDSEPEAGPAVERSDSDLAALLFTSGTAGNPKAAMLTHGNLAANLHQVQNAPVRSTRPDDVILCVVPLFHVLGLNSILNLALYAGATIVLIERFDPVSMIEMVAEEQASVLIGPPTMWAALSQVEDAPEGAMSSLRLAVSGAAPIPARVVRDCRDNLNIDIAEGYGLTEASPSVALSAGTGAPIGSIGRPIPGIELRLVDAEGDDVYIGDAGEIIVRGDNVFPGYWQDPEATARVIDSDGWLHTGDMAVVNDDGYLFIVDRAKDLIIVSGFNVYPAEVERVLVTHPSVAEAAVVGVPHPHTGEAVKAYVVPRSGRTIEEDDIIDWCATELARYKCPSKIDEVDELPHGLGGKILRRQLG